MEPLEVGVKKLAASGWTAGSAYDAKADAELMAEDRVEAFKRTERNSKSGFFTCEPACVGCLLDLCVLQNRCDCRVLQEVAPCKDERGGSFWGEGVRDSVSIFGRWFTVCSWRRRRIDAISLTAVCICIRLDELLGGSISGVVNQLSRRTSRTHKLAIL